MALFKHLIIESSATIEASPEKIWEFFFSINDNYQNQ